MSTFQVLTSMLAPKRETGHSHRMKGVTALRNNKYLKLLGRHMHTLIYHYSWLWLLGLNGRLISHSVSLRMPLGW